jgi:hypothetical protein
MRSSGATGGGSGQRNDTIDGPKWKRGWEMIRGGGNGLACCVMDVGQHRPLIWHDRTGKGKGNRVD